MSVRIPLEVLDDIRSVATEARRQQRAILSMYQPQHAGLGEVERAQAKLEKANKVLQWMDQLGRQADSPTYDIL